METRKQDIICLLICRYIYFILIYLAWQTMFNVNIFVIMFFVIVGNTWKYAPKNVLYIFIVGIVEDFLVLRLFKVEVIDHL